MIAEQRKRISLITVCYNSERTIEETIKSVIVQSCFNEIEYIIIDGDSQDRTLSIIKKYSDNVSIIVSEPDLGIYDAMNKGVKLASGEIIAFLNSDDFFTDAQSLQTILELFNNSEILIAFGNLDYIDKFKTGKIVRQWRSGVFKKEKLHWGWMPAHPAFFARRPLFDILGSFDLSFRIAADYDLMTRFLSNVNENQVAYVPLKIVQMRTGGESNKDGYRTVLKSLKECYYIGIKNGFPFPYFSSVMKVVRKIPQYFF